MTSAKLSTIGSRISNTSCSQCFVLYCSMHFTDTIQLLNIIPMFSVLNINQDDADLILLIIKLCFHWFATEQLQCQHKLYCIIKSIYFTNFCSDKLLLVGRGGDNPNHSGRKEVNSYHIQSAATAIILPRLCHVYRTWGLTYHCSNYNFWIVTVWDTTKTLFYRFLFLCIEGSAVFLHIEGFAPIKTLGLISSLTLLLFYLQT